MHNPTEAELKWLIFGGVFVMVMLSLSIIAFFITYQRRLIAEQNHLRKAQEDHQRELLFSGIHIQEQERNRIGQDMHDGLASSLTLIKMQVDQLNPERFDIHVKQKLSQDLSESINDVRNISYNLAPSVLAKFGLYEAVNHLLSIFSNDSKTAVKFDCEYGTPLIFDYELAIYRIVQELANNSIKHAKADNISLSIIEKEAYLSIIYADNGCGFNVGEQEKNHHGLGLKSIRTRVAILEGEVNINSEKERGTSFDISIPLKQINNL